MRRRIRQAAPTSVLVFVITGMCTAGVVIPLAGSVPARSLAEQPEVLGLYTAVRLLDSWVATPLRFSGLPAISLIIVAPFLQVAWLRAHLMDSPLHEHARAAASVYLQACAVYMAGGVYAALLVLVGSGGAHLAEWLLHGTHDLRLSQSVGLAVSAPFWLGATVHAPSLTDRVQLELARGRRLGVRPLRAALRAVDLRACLVRAGFGLGSLLVLGLALLPRVWLGAPAAAETWRSWLLLLLALVATLGRTLLRSAWLAWLSARADTPRAAASGGGVSMPSERSK